MGGLKQDPKGSELESIAGTNVMAIKCEVTPQTPATAFHACSPLTGGHNRKPLHAHQVDQKVAQGLDRVRKGVRKPGESQGWQS